MAKYGKWIGGGLGWVVGGPIGALLGFAVGNIFDRDGKLIPASGHQPITSTGDFEVSLLVLSAYVIKADGHVDEKEQDFVRAHFVRMFGQSRANESFRLFKTVVDHQEISVRQVCLQIQRYMDHPSRLQLLHFLFGVAQADGHVSEPEVKMIEQISGYLNINHRDYESIKAMFYKAADSYYKILEIEPSATVEEIKKAYRHMAKKYHPDKLQHLSVELQNGGKEKFQKMQEAYDGLKKERNFS